MFDDLLMGILLGMAYAYIGLLVVLLSMNNLDSWINKWVGDNDLKGFVLLVFWIPLVPLFYAAMLFGIRSKRLKDNQLG